MRVPGSPESQATAPTAHGGLHPGCCRERVSRDRTPQARCWAAGLGVNRPCVIPVLGPASSTVTLPFVQSRRLKQGDRGGPGSTAAGSETPAGSLEPAAPVGPPSHACAPRALRCLPCARPRVCPCLHLPHARSGRGGRQRDAALGWELCGTVLCWPLPVPPRGWHFPTPSS